MIESELVYIHVCVRMSVTLSARGATWEGEGGGGGGGAACIQDAVPASCMNADFAL